MIFLFLFYAILATMAILMATLTVSFQYIIYNNITFSEAAITIQKHTSNNNSTDKNHIESFNLFNDKNSKILPRETFLKMSFSTFE